MYFYSKESSRQIILKMEEIYMNNNFIVIKYSIDAEDTNRIMR